MRRSNVPVALLLVSLARCVSHGNGLVTETARTASRTGCDADVVTDQVNGIRLRLVNTSVSHACRATRMTLELKSGVERDWVQVSTPSGWSYSYVACTAGGRICGISWRSEAGVPPGECQDGFAVTCDPRRLKSWSVDVGERRVGEPYGLVGGRLAPAP